MPIIKGIKELISTGLAGREVINPSAAKSMKDHFSYVYSHFEKVIKGMARLNCLNPSYEQQVPNETAIKAALQILTYIRLESMVPSRIVASAEGGIAIVFVKGSKYADIECLNDGNIVIGITDRNGFIDAIDTSVDSIEEDLRKINVFIKSNSSSKDVA